MGWPFDLSGVPHYADFERFENASIEELLQPSSIPFGSVAEMHPPARNGVVMISNVCFYFTIFFLLTAYLFNIPLLMIMILRFRTL
jgi:hypothetical protein